MLLQTLLRDCHPLLPLKDPVFCNPDVTELQTDSRAAHAGCCFICLRGSLADGHRFAKAAYENGCRLFLAEKKLDLPSDAVVLILSDTRAALPVLASAFYGHPATALRIIGITGTKGKTTVASMLYQTATACGLSCGLIGTVGIRYGSVFHTTENTTPDPITLHKTFSHMKQAGVSTVFMEVSSQSVLQHRVDGLLFDTAVFLNLSHDHVGRMEHPTFENYMACKAELFKHASFAFLNRDDAHYDDFRAACACPFETFGFNPSAVYRAEQIHYLSDTHVPQTRFFYTERGRGMTVTIPLPGACNVSNALAALAVLKRVGIGKEAAADAFAQLRIPGRFEVVDALPFCTFVIDYAHNGVSAEQILRTVRLYQPARVITLFGSVGGRSDLRREELATVCSALADFSILTSDNPDFEDPLQICNEIASYYPPGDASHIIIPDRREAIRYAVAQARAGDMILLLGKGHENYQLINGVKQPFCEIDELLQASAERLLERHEGKA